MHLLAIVICVTAMASTIAEAATFSWNASSGNWNSTGNWTPTANPNSTSDTVVFGTGTSATLNLDRSIGTVIFNRDASFSLDDSGNRILTIQLGIYATSPEATGRTYSLAPDISLSTNNTWDIGGNTTLSISGTINDVGTRGLTKNGSGLLILLSASNSFDGALIINSGTIQTSLMNNLNSDSPIGDSSTITLNGGVLKWIGTSDNSTDRVITLDANGGGIDASAASTGNNLTITGNMAASASTGTQTLTLTGSNTGANTISGNIVNGSGSNITNLVKSGAGKWVISRNSAASYTDTTTVSAGTLALAASSGTNNPIANSSKIYVDNGGNLDVSGISTSGNFRLGSAQTLAGTGDVYGTVTSYTSGSKVMPGDTDTPGTLTLHNNFTLSSGTALAIESNGSTFSLLSVGGNVTLGGSLALKANFQPALNTPITIVDKTSPGAVSGIFAGLAQGAYFHPASGTYASDWYSISYTGGDSNDVTISRHAVPEPGSLSLLVMSGVAMLRRRR